MSLPVTADMPHLAIDPFSDNVLNDPHDYYRRLREIGPVARLDQSEGFEIVAVGRDAVARAIFENYTLFVNSRGGGITDLATGRNFREPAMMQEVDPPLHDRTRGVMNEIVSPRNVRAMRAAFQVAADEIIDGLLQRESFDAQTDLAEAFPLRVIPDFVMGARPEGRENLLRYSTFAFESMGPLTPRARRVLDELGDISHIVEWIQDSCARENVSPDSIGAKVWAAAEEDRLSEAQAKNIVRSLLGAGIDTTIHALANTLYLLATHPREFEKVQREPARAKFAFEEALRYAPPVRQVYRTPAVDTQIEGTPVKEGQKILIVPGATNRDPERWGPTAEIYDIDHNAGGHLAMGRGIHQCVGAPIARLEADVLLSTLVSRITKLELDGEPQRLLNNSLYGFASLPVRITTK
jgi:cytochrome P450